MIEHVKVNDAVAVSPMNIRRVMSVGKSAVVVMGVMGPEYVRWLKDYDLVGEYRRHWFGWRLHPLPKERLTALRSSSR